MATDNPQGTSGDLIQALLYRCTDRQHARYLVRAWIRAQMPDGKFPVLPRVRRWPYDVGGSDCPDCWAPVLKGEVHTCMTLPRKSESPVASASSTLSVSAGTQFEQYSSLWEFLTLTRWEDGKKRRTGRLSLSLDVGGLRLSLSCEETGQYASLQGQEMESLFLAVEMGLRENSLTWRPSSFSSRRKQ